MNLNRTLARFLTAATWMAIGLGWGPALSLSREAPLDADRAIAPASQPAPGGAAVLPDVSATVEQPTLPALVGNPYATVARVRIDVAESSAPLPSVAQLEISTAGTTSLEDLEAIQVFYTGKTAEVRGIGGPQFFAAETQFGGDASPADSLVLVGDQPLQPGPNYFWISFRLRDNASLDHRVDASCTAIGLAGDHVVTPAEGATSSQRIGSAVRRGGDDGVHTYRIPGLATSSQGTLLAVYDIRRRSGGDLPGDIDVGLSRSIDRGASWEPMRVIMDMGDDPQWRYDGIGDPAILVDRVTGTIWVAALWSHGNRGWGGSGPGLEPEQTGQWILVRSDDDGETWSEPINITSQIKRPEWCLLLQGPGKGITLLDGTLVFAAQYQDTPGNQRVPRSTVVFSRDQGATWQIGEGAFDDTTEAQVVELTPGELMLNCRYNREPFRVVVTSGDLGSSWQPHPTSRQALQEPRACMASLIHVDRELGSGEGTRLLFSNPDHPTARQRMTIKFSPDHGLSWPADSQVLLDAFGSAGYSCLSMIDAETVGILYEGSQAHMTFQRVPLTEIIR